VKKSAIRAEQTLVEPSHESSAFQATGVTQASKARYSARKLVLG